MLCPIDKFAELSSLARIESIWLTRSAYRRFLLDGYESGRRHRQLILDFLAVVPFEGAAESTFRTWVAEEALPSEPHSTALEDQIGAWFAHSRVTRPGSYRLDRLVAAARLAHDERTFRTVAAHLDAETRCRLGEEALQSDTSRIGLQP